MSYYSKIAANVLFPLHERLKGHTTIDVFHTMEKNQWLPPAELQQLQVEKLRKFLVNIGQRVPYYCDLFRSLAFNPQDITSIADLQALPLLGKPEIRANTERLKADNAKGLQRFNTGGSSGEPLIFYLDRERVSHDVAAKRRATRWWDVDIGDPEIVVWGSPIELGAQDRMRQLRDKLFRTELLSAFEMSELNLDYFLKEIRRARPRMLFGYPSSLAHIAGFATEKGIRMDDLGIRVAFTTSEMLYDHQRSQIQGTFGCPVANGYGGRDAGFIAHQCPIGSMHITAEDIIVEIVDDSGDVLPAGESGEIVVTHMATRGFPFVRYKTGDIGALDAPGAACSCGRGLPVLKDLVGRSTDFVIAQDGTVVHGLALIYILRDLPGIKAFKVVQDSLAKISVYIIKDNSYAPDNADQIEHVFKARLGEGVKIEIEEVDSLPLEASGKFRYVVSRVQR